jgi:hypothetical protein
MTAMLIRPAPRRDQESLPARLRSMLAFDGRPPIRF